MDAVTDDRGQQFSALAGILEERWTCRQFRPDAVPRGDIERVLALSQRTPSWCNTQPWQVIVTEGEGTDRFRRTLQDHVRGGGTVQSDIPFPTQYAGDYRDRRRACGLQLYDSVGIEKGDPRALAQMLRNFDFFDAPHVAVITTEADLGEYGAIDCGLYVNTFLLSAHSLGIATAPQAALASYSGFLHDYFDIPEHRRVVLGISFGYADLEHPINSFRTERADVTNVATWIGD
ncbi:nitroreductase [Rhodococcus sp. 05-2255-1e]|uniref:nitroreductase n=1 Tax=Rhodococcus sp. 05-2255-1e TaxID=2022495 RepID=UPI000B9AE8CB|nr:nitroreductase [Rhodococcus sp. 05-2255-1e]OZE28783.1 nitroreductase [Rhodococcus sp. 05-2255-1e]